MSWKDIMPVIDGVNTPQEYVNKITMLVTKNKKYFLKKFLINFFANYKKLDKSQIDITLQILRRAGIKYKDISGMLNMTPNVKKYVPILENGLRSVNVSSRYPTVEEYYKQDCKKEDVCDCVPNSVGYDQPCSFFNEELIVDPEEKRIILRNFGYDLEHASREALDFIDEFPIFILKKHTTICHSTRKDRILDGYAKLYKGKAWWNTFFPGHEKYGGGWFTYETDFGGPEFGINLYYYLQKNIPLLFVPNYRKLKDDPAYFPDEKYPWNYPRDGDGIPEYFTGSHLVQGVKNWKEKGYSMIKPKYFADELAEKLVSLEFPGYISCDECEVFLTHKSMKRVLDQPPYRIQVKIDDKEVYKSTFEMVIELLCKGDKYCPLQINSGNRDDEIDLQELTDEEIQDKLKVNPKEFKIKYIYETK